MKEIDSPDYRAMTAAERREEYEAELEQQFKEDLAIELTAQLKTKMAQNQWGDEVQHPQCPNQQIEIRELLAEWIDQELENTPAVAVALIEAAAGDINPVKELLDGFVGWYEKECMK